VRVLIVEDVKSDITLLLLALREGGFEVTYEAVTTQAAMRVALRHHQWDLITSDHGMPQFSGPAALASTLELTPDVPFIIVSGEIDINVAVALMQAGARDYVQKAELLRLVPVVHRVLLESKVRSDKVLADQALIASEAQYRRLFESAQDGILIVDAGTGQIQDVNPFLLDLLGFSREEYLCCGAAKDLHGRDRSHQGASQQCSDTAVGNGAPSSAYFAGEQQAFTRRALSACIALSSFSQSSVCRRIWVAPMCGGMPMR
jgi:CheY-like chemotaxis protein